MSIEPTKPAIAKRLNRVVLPVRALRLVLPAVALLAAALVWQIRAIELDQPGGVVVCTPRYHEAIVLQSPPGEVPLRIEPRTVPLAVELEQGRTIGGLLGDLGVASGEMAPAIASLGEHLDIRSIRAGTVGLAYLDDHDRLTRLRLEQRDGWVELARDGRGWNSAKRLFERRTDTKRIVATLDGALEQAVRAAGGEPRVTYRMADVLQWDLDFNRDLRLGDRFQVLYEEVYLDGRYDGPGEVQAIVYENQGSRLEAYRFDDGYYDADGRPLQKMFLRSPLSFSRVTSRFSHSRLHPILKVRRPHYGVDYGAPRGTPVRVTAHGTVTFAGRSGGAGNMVKVRHPNGYVTAYLHLSRFAKGVRPGTRVRQSDVIGYVGSTGLSTAPHLDYRVQKSGRWIDPLSLERTPAEPLAKERLSAFFAARDALRAQLGSEDASPSPTVFDVAQSAPEIQVTRPAAGIPGR